MIRRATLTDAEAIARVQVWAWKAAYVGLMPQSVLDALCVKEKALVWKDALSKPSPGVTLVAERDGSVVAFAVFGPSRDEDAASAAIGELVALNVAPDHWHQGIARSLLSRVLQEARLCGWERLTLWVLHGNHRARELYERLGFIHDGSEKRDTRLTGSEIREVRYQMQICDPRRMGMYRGATRLQRTH